MLVFAVVAVDFVTAARAAMLLSFATAVWWRMRRARCGNVNQLFGGSALPPSCQAAPLGQHIYNMCAGAVAALEVAATVDVGAEKASSRALPPKPQP